jgi:hypothetical protein
VELLPLRPIQHVARNHEGWVYLLGGVFLVVFGLFLVNLGAVVLQEAFLFHGLSHLSLGEHPLGENGVFPLSTHPSLEVSSPRLNLGTYFLEGPCVPLGGIFGPRSIHSFGTATIPKGTHSQKTHKPSTSTNIGGPQAPSGTKYSSPPS